VLEKKAPIYEQVLEKLEDLDQAEILKEDLQEAILKVSRDIDGVAIHPS
jgi:hypothetical protein